MTLIQILESREEALDVHQVAELLKVSERHIYELAADGSLPAFRVGKAIRFDPHDVADWLRKNKRLEQQHGPLSPQKAETRKANRSRPENSSSAHVWRNKVNSFEGALAIDSLSMGKTTKNS